jgi:hypothetical protein
METNMTQPNFDVWTDAFKHMQAPVQALIDLNVKTMQALLTVKPDLTLPKKPEEFVEKNIQLVLSQGKKTLDYLHSSFDIVEKAMLSMVDDTKSKEKK